MAGGAFRPSVLSMRKTFPVIWSLHGDTHTGKLDVTKERIELTSRGYTFAFPRDSVIQFVVERGAEARIRGLTVDQDSPRRRARRADREPWWRGLVARDLRAARGRGPQAPLRQGLAGAGT